MDIENAIFIDENADLHQIKNTNTVKFICKDCDNAVYMIFKCFKKSKLFLCKSCKTKKTCTVKYGSPNMFASDALKQARLKKQNGKWITDDAKEKMKTTKTEKYDDPYYTNRAKSAESFKRHKEEKPHFLESIKEKTKNTCMQKYNVEHVSHTQEWQDKHKLTCLEKYGTEWYFQSNDAKTKITQSLLTRYNVEHALQCDKFKTKAFSKHGMTRPEKKIYEFLTNRKFQFKHQYAVNGKSFDFAIFNNDKLEILIEIDGVYFHGLLEDCNGKHSRGELDHERFALVPENVKFIVCDDKNIDACFSEILKVYDINYDKWIDDMIEALPANFPYPSYTLKRMMKDYDHLIKNDYNKHANLGLSIIHNFHKSIWTAHRENMLSPVSCWQDPEKLKKSVKNRVIYSSSLSSQQIARGFNISGIAKTVSVFNASLAKHIIETYLAEYDTVFDPFSGFSGRMLGTCACNKKYIGQDINEKHVNESNEIIKTFNLNAAVTEKDIFESEGEYDCLFTCSPYHLKEIWNETETDMSCDAWIDECLKRFKCKRYVFVVDETEKYKDFVAETLVNKSHFGKNNEFIIVINNIK